MYRATVHHYMCILMVKLFSPHYSRTPYFNDPTIDTALHTSQCALQSQAWLSGEVRHITHWISTQFLSQQISIHSELRIHVHNEGAWEKGPMWVECQN